MFLTSEVPLQGGDYKPSGAIGVSDFQIPRPGDASTPPKLGAGNGGREGAYGGVGGSYSPGGGGGSPGGVPGAFKQLSDPPKVISSNLCDSFFCLGSLLLFHTVQG